jgi:hypothetical protein
MRSLRCSELHPNLDHLDRRISRRGFSSEPRGVEVRHITGKGEPSLHRVTPFATVTGGHITYPATDTLPL